MEWSTSFRAIPPALREELPGELHGFRWSASHWMAKLWYGNKALHYEIWIRHSPRVLELGLHFESDALTNARLLGAFRARAKQVKRELGARARIEAWDRGWARVWEPFALERLEAEFSERIRSRFIEYVRILEPILRDELPNDVEWQMPVPRTTAARRPSATRQGESAAASAARSTSYRRSR